MGWSFPQALVRNGWSFFAGKRGRIRAPRTLGTFTALVELLLFNTQAPVNAVLLDCVPTNLRNFSMSYNVLIIHLLGTPAFFCVGNGPGRRWGPICFVYPIW